MDISQADSPVLLGSLDTPGVALGVAVDGNTAYLADGASGLRVISVSDPARPLLLGGLTTRGEVRGVVLDQGILYAIDSVDGLLILDTANPTMPQVVDRLPVDGEPLGISIEPQYPDRLLVPVRTPDGEEMDLVFLTDSAGVILEGTLGPDPDNPALETILVSNPSGAAPDDGFTPDQSVPINQDPVDTGSAVVLEGTLEDSGRETGPLDSTLVNNPSSGGNDGFQLDDTSVLLR